MHIGNSFLLRQRQKGVIARSILLRTGGPLASELASHAVVLKVNDWVFCHGGLLPHHGNYFATKLELYDIQNIILHLLLRYS